MTINFPSRNPTAEIYTHGCAEKRFSLLKILPRDLSRCVK